MKRKLKINGKQIDPEELDCQSYRKKPVVVKAIRIHEPFEVDTLEGTMRGNPGDYLIQGVKGEYYPCKPDIFEETYEKTEEE